MRDPTECCGLCSKFTRSSQERSNLGFGYCTIYEQEKHCTDRPTVLFTRANRGQMNERTALIEKHRGSNDKETQQEVPA